MTNADKIRQMTDEELAYLIMPDDYTDCPVHIIGDRECIDSCTDCVLKWLQEEATDD